MIRWSTVVGRLFACLHLAVELELGYNSAAAQTQADACKTDGLACLALLSNQKCFHMTQTTFGSSCLFATLPPSNLWNRGTYPFTHSCTLSKHIYCGVYCNLKENQSVVSSNPFHHHQKPPSLLERLNPSPEITTRKYYQTINLTSTILRASPRVSLRSWRAVPQSASAVKRPVLPLRIALQLSSLHQVGLSIQFAT